MRLLDVFPVLAINHERDRPAVDAEGARESGDAFTAGPDGTNGVLRKFMHTVTDSARMTFRVFSAAVQIAVGSSSFLNLVSSVVGCCSKEKMRRVNTTSDVAFVTDAQSFWDLSMRQFVRDTMRSARSTLSMTGHAISSLWIDMSGPQPTVSSLVNARPKSSGKAFTQSIVVALSRAVTLGTARSLLSAQFAVSNLVSHPARTRAIVASPRIARLAAALARPFGHRALSMCRSMMRRTSSAMEMPRRLASRFRYALCGSVNEIICFVMSPCRVKGVSVSNLNQPRKAALGTFHVDVWFDVSKVGAIDKFIRVCSEAFTAATPQAFDLMLAARGTRLWSWHFENIHPLMIPQGIKW